MDIVIDFDGTVVKHKFPAMGEDIGAEPVLRELVNAGHNLILFTMRSNAHKTTVLVKEEIPTDGNYLSQAIYWFLERGIPLYGVQFNPTQTDWTNSPKAYGQLIIDDAALGCPLIQPDNNERPYVDWKAVRKQLQDKGVLPKKTLKTIFN